LEDISILGKFTIRTSTYTHRNVVASGIGLLESLTIENLNSYGVVFWI